VSGIFISAHFRSLWCFRRCSLVRYSRHFPQVNCYVTTSYRAEYAGANYRPVLPFACQPVAKQYIQMLSRHDSAPKNYSNKKDPHDDNGIYKVWRRVHACDNNVDMIAVTTCGFYRAMLCIRGTSHGPVSVSLCLSQVGVLSKRMNESSCFLACELLSTRPTLC